METRAPLPEAVYAVIGPKLRALFGQDDFYAKYDAIVNDYYANLKTDDEDKMTTTNTNYDADVVAAKTKPKVLQFTENEKMEPDDETDDRKPEDDPEEY